LTPARKGPVPALVVPDEQTWAALGADPATYGARPSFDPATVHRLLAPRLVPEEIAAAVTEYRTALGDEVPVHYAELAFAGDAAVSATLAPRHHGHDHHSHSGHEHEHGEHDHAGHHDMMAIVGEPSADGLVMEPIRLSYGPIGTPLPGGLVADVTLDGDVVAESDVRALLRVEPPAIVPDLLSPVAWTVAMAGAAALATSPWIRVAAVEIERAVSHLAWLRSLGRLVDSTPLIERCTETLEALQVSRRVLPDDELTEGWLRAAVGEADLEDCRKRLEDLVEWVGQSWALRLRLRGRAVVTQERARELALRGPVGRASAVDDDARTADPLYQSLDFKPVLQPHGDALSRARLRTEEALMAVGLAVEALELEYVGADAPTADPQPPAVVESPRGPITARSSSTGTGELAAPAAAATRRVAADSMIGSEWSTALVGLASFDLSPWEVG
jgi:hypothetical protein